MEDFQRKDAKTQRRREDWEILPAVLGDAGAVADCVRVAYGHYLEEIGVEPGPLLDDYEAILRPFGKAQDKQAQDEFREHSVWVVKSGEVVVGVLVLIEKPEMILLDNVAVRPEGQGRGIGRALMDFAEAEAVRRGYGWVQLYTHELMVVNQAIYAKRGYEEFDRRVELGLNRVYMRKNLYADKHG